MASASKRFSKKESEDVFDRIGDFVLEPCEEAAYLGLTLWNAATDKDTPIAIRGMLFGPVVYLANPADVVPDVLPVVGLSDDLGVLASAVALLAAHIKPIHRRKAREQIKCWLNQE